MAATTGAAAVVWRADTCVAARGSGQLLGVLSPVPEGYDERILRDAPQPDPHTDPEPRSTRTRQQPIIVLRHSLTRRTNYTDTSRTTTRRSPAPRGPHFLSRPTTSTSSNYTNTTTTPWHRYAHAEPPTHCRTTLFPLPNSGVSARRTNRSYATATQKLKPATANQRTQAQRASISPDPTLSHA